MREITLVSLKTRLVLVPVLVEHVGHVLPVLPYCEESLLHVEGAAGHPEGVQATALLRAAELARLWKTE